MDSPIPIEPFPVEEGCSVSPPRLWAQIMRHHPRVGWGKKKHDVKNFKRCPATGSSWSPKFTKVESNFRKPAKQQLWSCEAIGLFLFGHPQNKHLAGEWIPAAHEELEVALWMPNWKQLQTSMSHNLVCNQCPLHVIWGGGNCNAHGSDFTSKKIVPAQGSYQGLLPMTEGGAWHSFEALCSPCFPLCFPFLPYLSVRDLCTSYNLFPSK